MAPVRTRNLVLAAALMVSFASASSAADREGWRDGAGAFDGRLGSWEGTLAAAARHGRRGHPGARPERPRGELVAITLKTDPAIDPEAACVALQIGANLLMDAVPVGDTEVEVRPARAVTLFPTLGGVGLVDPAVDMNAIFCNVPGTEGPLAEAPLSAVLQGFIDSGGEILVCALCALDRGIYAPTAGHIGNAEEVHELFLEADKVIDF